MVRGWIAVSHLLPHPWRCPSSTTPHPSLLRIKIARWVSLSNYVKYVGASTSGTCHPGQSHSACLSACRARKSGTVAPIHSYHRRNGEHGVVGHRLCVPLSPNGVPGFTISHHVAPQCCWSWCITVHMLSCTGSVKSSSSISKGWMS